MKLKKTKELCAIGDKCGLKIPTLFEFLGWVYDTTDVFKQDAYKGFKCPYLKVENGYVPDFNHRYFTEDIPYGLCVYKGIAQIVDVPTPFIDTLIRWAQKHMGVIFLDDDGKLTDAAVCPQHFGITTLEGLLG